MLRVLNSKYSGAILICFMGVSFWFGQHMRDMNLFAASGGVATVFGLFSLIRFTTIEKYLNQDQIIRSSTGVTGKPLSREESERIQRENIERAGVRIKAELQSELIGIALTVVGTLIWAGVTFLFSDEGCIVTPSTMRTWCTDAPSASTGTRRIERSALVETMFRSASPNKASDIGVVAARKFLYCEICRLRDVVFMGEYQICLALRQ